MISPSAHGRLVVLAQKILDSKKEWDGDDGVSSKFFPISENWGVKFVKDGDEKIARGIYNRQLEAWKMGLGPYCFGFSPFNYAGDRVWGYITEVVQIYARILEHMKYQEDMASDQQIKHMQRLFIQRLDFKFADCHAYNVGVRGRKLLCIDFGKDGCELNSE